MRDYSGQMHAIIRAELAGRLVDQAGAGTVATGLVRRLRAQDPALLMGFLQLHAAETLAAHIARRHPAPVRRGPSKAAQVAEDAVPADA